MGPTHELPCAPLSFLQATEVSRVPDRPVFALFAEQPPPGGRPGVWHRAGSDGSDRFPRLSVLSHHEGLSSFAATLSRQKGRPRSLIIVILGFVLRHAPGQV